MSKMMKFIIAAVLLGLLIVIVHKVMNKSCTTTSCSTQVTSEKKTECSENDPNCKTEEKTLEEKTETTVKTECEKKNPVKKATLDNKKKVVEKKSPLTTKNNKKK